MFPYKAQLEKLAHALNIPIAADAEPYLDFYDFVLERQKAVPGPNPWSGPWEKVDIQNAYDVLKNVVDYDVPIVDVAYTDAVFTMPLPYRVAGEWGEKVTHPRIKKLSKEQAEEQMLLNAKMLELYEKMKKEQEPFQKRGFAIGQVDIRDVRSQVASTNMRQVLDMIKQELQSGEYTSFQEGLGKQFDPDQLIRDLSQTPVATSAQVLLFRYLDFDVEPGNAYRYRVRLVVRNPNYQRPIAELVDPASAEGFTRMTPWSEPSNMAFVPQDEEVFLSGVNRVRGRSDISADLEVFKWYEDSGTMIRANLAKLHAGDPVAGVVTTEVLRPAEQTFEEEEGVEVKTKNILVDL
ncbi:MAG TPA: hypothetical protein EYP14_09630, partial [Planctomycetaceae bacterium]|nr:hypothetical protein [Planctomycetaceae bacterium]